MFLYKCLFRIAHTVESYTFCEIPMLHHRKQYVWGLALDFHFLMNIQKLVENNSVNGHLIFSYLLCFLFGSSSFLRSALHLFLPWLPSNVFQSFLIIFFILKTCSLSHSCLLTAFLFDANSYWSQFFGVLKWSSRWCWS